MDYYAILGIKKNSTDDDIKKAYRKLAREKHPDKGGTTEEFQKIQKAYETLGDNDKRREYDNPNQHSRGNMFNFKQRMEKCGNHTYTCKVTLKDVYYGITKKFRIKKDKVCNSCYLDCSNCDGNGIIYHNIQMGPFNQVIQQTCTICHGKGKCKTNVENCDKCERRGYITEEEYIEFVIPKGCENGYYEIFNEWGEQPTKNNQIPGDLLVVVNIEDLNIIFKRRGLDLLYETKISLKESLVGKELVIPYFDQDIKINSRGFGIINPNIQYTIFGKGLLNNSNKRGNLHVIFKIDYPQKSFSDDDYNKLNEVLENIKL